MLQEAAEAAASCGSNPAQFGTLRASTPSGKAKTQQNCTPRLPDRLLEMQPLIPQSNRKNHMHFHRDFITSVLAWERHLRPAVSKQVYFAGFFFFYVIRTNSSEMNHRVSRVSREMSSRPQV